MCVCVCSAVDGALISIILEGFHLSFSIVDSLLAERYAKVKTLSVRISQMAYPDYSLASPFVSSYLHLATEQRQSCECIKLQQFKQERQQSACCKTRSGR